MHSSNHTRRGVPFIAVNLRANYLPHNCNLYEVDCIYRVAFTTIMEALRASSNPH